jgi:cytochrome c oxidase assembly protein subunit 11
MSPPAPSDPKHLARRNGRVALICAVVFAGMVGAAYAAVPLYKAFCQATGFDGTIRKAEVAPTRILARKVLVRFDANVRDLPWEFTADQVSQSVRIGDTGLAFFRVTNNGKTPITGRASYNIVPEQAAAYFQKLECFCFTNQTVQPGATMEFPVVYFVDPEYATDPETKGGTEMTLSYTFFPVADEVKEQRADAASPLGEAAPGRL